MDMPFSPSQDINSFSYFKNNLNKVVKAVKEKRRPMLLTKHGKVEGVYMDVDTWEFQFRKMKMIELVSEGIASLKDGGIPLEEFEEKMKKKYGF